MPRLIPAVEHTLHLVCERDMNANYPPRRIKLAGNSVSTPAAGSPFQFSATKWARNGEDLMSLRALNEASKFELRPSTKAHLWLENLLIPFHQHL